MSNLNFNDDSGDDSDLQLQRSTPHKGQTIVIPTSDVTFPETYEMAIVSVPSKVCNPGPIGLFSLCIGCCVLIGADMGWTSSTVLARAPWLFWIPGVAQIVAGVLELFANNVFGSFAFVIYGGLWCGLSWTYVHLAYVDMDDSHEELKHFGWICVGFLIFSLILLLASLQLNKTFPLILVSISIALISLIFHVFFGTSSIPTGLFLLFVAIFAYYTAYAIILNTYFQKQVLNVGKPLYSWADKLQKKLEKKQDMETL
ncbi:inner membrane protein yaah [Anaeramoeba flamelloides]|uniref:Inner membrane protein yaah n=1 Tax=Anaeramoeba flamelloides TaxID=1746091 RepID=A0AAV7Y986_9EUKA|nr:inner membrane protein yaah [Anaeramoeba flamelloides]KAJ6228329.1 inner membrane protein yaah [Anaeramoeba flamelloides]